MNSDAEEKEYREELDHQAARIRSAVASLSIHLENACNEATMGFLDRDGIRELRFEARDEMREIKEALDALRDIVAGN